MQRDILLLSSYYPRTLPTKWRKLGLLACTMLSVFWLSRAYWRIHHLSDPSRRKLSESFPKKIWQISHYAPEQKPNFIDDYQELWQRFHPTYQYQCLNEENEDDFVRGAFHENDPAHMTYSLIKQDPILRADFLRYLVLLAEGGVYTDMDTRPMQPIDIWIPKEYVNQTSVALGVEIDKGQGRLWRDVPWTVQMSQFTIVAKPNHPLLRRVVDSVHDGIEQFLAEHSMNGKLPPLFFDDVIGLTGPRIFTSAVLQYLSEQTGLEMNGDELSGIKEPILLADVLIFPVNGFASGQLHSNSGTALDKTALVSHRWISSWVPTHPHQASDKSYIS